MAGVSRKARPTEWRGVTYRSKSEACLAKWLHDAGRRFQYEPEWATVGDWVPDFAIWLEFFGRPPGLHSPLIAVVEYKPSRVTLAYRNYLASKFDCLFDELVGGDWPFGIDLRFELWEGSFWDPENQSVSAWQYCNGWSDVADLHWREWGDTSELVTTRFDLEAED